MGFLPCGLGLEDDSTSFAWGPLSCNNGEREVSGCVGEDCDVRKVICEKIQR